MLVSFDGLDSSGKATQARLLTSHLKSKGVQTGSFQSPYYESESGRELKLRLQNKLGNWQHTPWEEKMGYFAINRVEHRDEVTALLEQGAIVIYDRYVPSSVAFMNVEAGHDVREAVEHLEYEVNKMPREDVSIFFDIPPKIAVDLLKGRKNNLGDEDEYTDYLSVQEALHEEYVSMAKRNPEHMLRIACIDGERLRGIEEIGMLVRSALAQKFPDKAQFFI